MFLTRDNTKLGMILGFLGPILGLVVIYWIKFPTFRFTDFLETVLHENRLITSIGSMSLLANAALFTAYVNTERDSTAKGIFIVTVIYGIAILLLKLLN